MHLQQNGELGSHIRPKSGWARFMLDRRCLADTSHAVFSGLGLNHPHGEYDEDTTCDYNMRREPSFHAGPRGSCGAK